MKFYALLTISIKKSNNKKERTKVINIITTEYVNQTDHKNLII